MKCESFFELMNYQRHCYCAAVADTKWIMSIHAQYDVGVSAAAQAFQLLYLKRCAVIWRRDFCGSHCRFRDTCELGKALIERDANELQ